MKTEWESPGFKPYFLLPVKWAQLQYCLVELRWLSDILCREHCICCLKPDKGFINDSYYCCSLPLPHTDWSSFSSQASPVSTSVFSLWPHNHSPKAPFVLDQTPQGTALPSAISYLVGSWSEQKSCLSFQGLDGSWAEGTRGEAVLEGSRSLRALRVEGSRLHLSDHSVEGLTRGWTVSKRIYRITLIIEKDAGERYRKEGSARCVVKQKKQNLGHPCRMVPTT